MNKVELEGVVAFDIVAKFGEKNYATLTLNVAREGVSGYDSIRVVFFGDIVNDVIKIAKRSRVNISGKLNSSSWTTKDGKKTNSLNVIGSKIELIAEPEKEDFFVEGGEDVPF
jgi:single-stranded DNA-binding protein